MRDPKVQKLFTNIVYEALAERVDILDTPFIPPTPNWGPSFDEWLHLATDGKIHEMID